jgi:ribosomal protein S18 acetylase RimI-like enzyme
VKIRVATEQDAPETAKAEWTTAETLGMLVGRVEEIPVTAFASMIGRLSDQGCYWVAEEGGHLVGHAFLDPMKMLGNAHVFVLNIVVHPGETGRGTGSRLLQHALDWARANPSLNRIELLVRSTNARAIALYRKFGFFEEGGCSGESVRQAGSSLMTSRWLGFLIGGATPQQDVAADKGPPPDARRPW